MTKDKQKQSEEIMELAKNKFVNYKLEIPEGTDYFALLRVPKLGCIVRSHRYGSIKRRGFKEECLENRYNLKINNMYLIVMHTDDGYSNYFKVKVPYLSTEIDRILQTV